MAELPLILVVEDNERNRRLVEMVLQRDYRLAFAEDGEQALTMVGELEVDLVLLDIQIPKIDGTEVARRLKSDAATKSIPVVALTSFAMEADRRRILDAGCDGYVTKPFETRSLATEVRRYLDGSDGGRHG